MQLNVAEAAAILDVSQSTLLRWINDQDLPAKEVNGHFHFSPADLLEWAAVHGVAVRVERMPNGTSANDSIVGALACGGIAYDVPGADKTEVLTQVVRGLPVPEADRPLLLDLFLAREAAGSTAVGDGIAIPHPRHPVVLAAERPLLKICFLSKPIDFGPHVPENVDTLFVLISPSIQSHLRMLARLACLLRDETLRALIKRRASEDEIFREARRVESGLERSFVAAGAGER